MIFDSTEHFINDLPKYMPRLHELKELLLAVRCRSFEELRAMDFPMLDVRFGEYETQPAEKIPFEAHRKYWDLQLLLEGEELLGYAPLEKLQETEPYDPKEDIAFYAGSGDDVKLQPGTAVLLAPWDAHRPGADAGFASCRVKKIVVKLDW